MSTQSSSTQSHLRRARPRAWLAVVAFAALLASCETALASSSNGVTQAAATVAKYEKPSSFKPVGGPISGVKAKLAGKTVYYIPISQQVPIFPIIEAGLKQALSKVGAKLHVCDAGATPSGASSCISQAIADRAGAVITDSIPYGFAAQGFDHLEAHKIPILLADEPSAGPHGPVAGNDKLAFLETNQTLVMSLSADWIIAHSHGKANVLVIEITDSPLTIQAITHGALAQFKSKCPGCTVNVVTESTANLQNLGSLVSSALLKDPSTNYVFSEFDTDVQPAVGGVVASNFSSKVEGVSSMGILGSMQMLKSGDFLNEDTGSDGILDGWEYADQVFRMLLKKPVVQHEDTIHRIFTQQDIGKLALTPTGETNGSWYTTTNIQSTFEKLWGLS